MTRRAVPALLLALVAPLAACSSDAPAAPASTTPADPVARYFERITEMGVSPETVELYGGQGDLALFGARVCEQLADGDDLNEIVDRVLAADNAMPPATREVFIRAAADVPDLC